MNKRNLTGPDRSDAKRYELDSRPAAAGGRQPRAWSDASQTR